MADIEFQEPQYGVPAQSAGPKRSWLANLVISTGLATDDASAQRVLLIVLVLTIIAIVLVWVI